MNTTQIAALASLTIADVRTVYSGKPGLALWLQGQPQRQPGAPCRGRQEPRLRLRCEDVSERNVKRVLAKVQGQSATAEADDDCAWFSFETPTRVYVVYLCDAAVARIKAGAVAV